MQQTRSSVPLLRTKSTESGAISGTAARFGVPDRYHESFAKNAFTASLQRHADYGTKPALLINHRSSEPGGVWDVLAETDDGLQVEGRLATEAPQVRAVLDVAKMGGMGLSVGFMVESEADLEMLPTGVLAIKRADLIEVSLVSTPAGRGTQASVKALSAAQGVREVEEVLRDQGYSKREATARAGAVWRAINESGPSQVDDDVAALLALLPKL